MKRNDLVTKLLAIGGTILVWLPLLFPILLAGMAYFSYGALFLDYLMPAELFPLALAGAALLLAAAWRAHDHQRLITATAAVAAAALGLLLLSPGARPGTWMFALLAALLVLYAASLAATGAGGALLLHDLFRRTPA